MIKYKLKKWVLPSIYILSLTVMILSVIFVGNIMLNEYDEGEEIKYVSDEIFDEATTEVTKITNETVNHPYLLANVSVAKNFYNENESEDNQIKSLLFYKNTYMPNTGVLYISDEAFDVVSVLDGTVTSITEDEILGKVVEITHSSELITIYHCLNEISVKEGDQVKQNDVLGISGSVNIDSGYENALLFEVNYQGKILNPNEFFNMQISDLLK